MQPSMKARKLTIKILQCLQLRKDESNQAKRRETSKDEGKKASKQIARTFVSKKRKQIKQISRMLATTKARNQANKEQKPKQASQTKATR